MIFLGLETTCDETSAGVIVRDNTGHARILSNVISSQLALHAPYGGVVPELAARAHVENMDVVISEAMAQAQISFQDLDGVAAAAGPGLIGGVIVGLTAGKALALALNKPFCAINHLEAHALSARLEHHVPFPYLLLLVSGGHTQLIAVLGVGQYHRLGTTIDDAAGEAFDKVAKMLDLPYPGGPIVEELALKGDAARFALPRPMLGKLEPDFSFSGLKTAVRHVIVSLPHITDQDKADICACFQAAMLDVFADRVIAAMRVMQNLTSDKVRTMVAAGGVAANAQLRSALARLAKSHGMDFVCPKLELCGDNGAMIAWAGIERIRMGYRDEYDFAPRARWPLDARFENTKQKA